MHLINCLQPVTITLYGEAKKVPCGVCEYCRNARNTSMSERIRLEMQTHKYNIFGTLTYADLFLPKMSYNDELKGFYIPGDFMRNSNDEGLFVYFPWIDKKSRYYINHRLEKYGFIPRLCKKDFQDFLKRVRRRIDYHIVEKLLKDNIIKENEKQEFQISFALCGEYGPTLYRPHAHFIVSFDRQEIAKDIKSILRSCWPYGSSSYRWTSDDRSSGYVAQYVNGFNSLPSCYKPREFRPFLLVSKSHPLGFDKISEEEIQRIFYSASPTCNLYDNAKQRYVELPLWSTFERRLFPKFSGFDFVPHRLRTFLVEYALKSLNFDFFCQDLSYLRSSQKNKFEQVYIELRQYLDLLYKGRSGLSVKPDSALRSVWYASHIIQRNMHKFCVNSVDDYIKQIEKYFSNVEYYRLTNQLSFEQDYISRHPNDFKYIDPFLHDENVFNTKDVSNAVFDLHTRLENSHKNKRKNEYLAHHPDRFVFRKYDEFLEGF